MLNENEKTNIKEEIVGWEEIREIKRGERRKKEGKKRDEV